MKKKVVFAIGGSSGARYAYLLMKRLAEIPDQWDKVGLVMSKNAKLNWSLEVKESPYDSFGFDIYENNDFFALKFFSSISSR